MTTLLRASFNRKQEAEALENSQLLRQNLTCQSNFELILEQCVANYYGDNTIVK